MRVYLYVRIMTLLRQHIVFFLGCVLSLTATLVGGERAIIQLKDFTEVELKSGGLTLQRPADIHITALGGGTKSKSTNTESGMYAYGWIINAETREKVWAMTYDNTSKKGDDREFNNTIHLNAGSYEVYFTAHSYWGGSAFFQFNFNIDRRRDKEDVKHGEKEGFFSWFYKFFDSNFNTDWKKASKEWGITVELDESIPYTAFNPPQPFQNIVYRAVNLGENEHIKQGISLSKPVTLRIYALGEAYSSSGELADHGWIIDAKTRKRIWEMKKKNVRHAGGDKKNKIFDGKIEMPQGEYILYYITDDSHSYLDWNASPPNDPLNYGITLMTLNKNDASYVNLVTPKEEENVILKLTEVGNDEHRSASFTLTSESEIRIYALGERSSSRRRMADYGWMINAKTREKVWEMIADNTEHAGGASKNRVVDEIMKLPKGTYTVFYQTDDSHAFGDWNDDPPFDQEHYGITIYGAGEHFSMKNVETNVTPSQAGLIKQIIRVPDDANYVETFRLNKQTKIRIYALGEGMNRQMYDYGWIENAATGEIVWEMTYSMTFHAGGGRKNRMVNTTIILDKGEYKLHYVSDDSHSYNDWNVDPPDDPTMWGISLYYDEQQ